LADQTPEAAKPAVPRQSVVNVSPASLKGPPAPAIAPPAVEPARAELPKEDLSPRFAELEKAHAKLRAERRELSEQRKAFKAAEEKVAAYEKLHAERLRNPDKYLKAEYGEDYYDKVTRLRVDGIPPADLVASEVDDQVARIHKKLEETTSSFEKRLAERDAAEAQREKMNYLNGAIEYSKANPEKFKRINHFNEFNSIPQEIERHFQATSKQDADGTWQPGEILSHEKAAEVIEGRIKELGEQFRKYFALETPAAAPTARTDPTPRRYDPSQSKDWVPPKNDAERWRRAMEAGERHLSSRQQH